MSSICSMSHAITCDMKAYVWNTCRNPLLLCSNATRVVFGDLVTAVLDSNGKFYYES